MYLELLCYQDTDLPKYWHPYYIYIIMVDNNEVGRITLRTTYSDINYYTGHIGYDVLEQYRNNGYATKSLLLLKDKIKELGYDYVWITCNPSNIISKKIINKVATYVETKEVPKEYMIYLNDDEKIKEIYKWEVS